MDEWYANAQDEESDEGWEESIPLESDGFPVGTESRGSVKHFGHLHMNRRWLCEYEPFWRTFIGYQK